MSKVTPIRASLDIAFPEGNLVTPTTSQGGGGEPPSDRLVRLEEWSRLADGRLSRIDDRLDQIAERIGSLPTRADVRNYAIGVVGLVVAVIALVFGGLALLKDEPLPPTVTASPVAPTVPQIIFIPAPKS